MNPSILRRVMLNKYVTSFVPTSAWFLKPEYSSLYITDCTIFSDFTLPDKYQIFLYLYIADNFHLRAIERGNTGTTINLRMMS